MKILKYLIYFLFLPLQVRAKHSRLALCLGLSKNFGVIYNYNNVAILSVYAVPLHILASTGRIPSLHKRSYLLFSLAFFVLAR